MHPELQAVGGYFRALYRHIAIVASSFFVSLLLQGLEKWGPWNKAAPDWVSWLTLGLGLMIANYLVWRENWIKSGLERVSLPKDIELLQSIFHQDSHE